MKKATSPFPTNSLKSVSECTSWTTCAAESGKPTPTEADVRRLLARLNPTAEAASAKQISRYCQTDKPYLRDAREETLDHVAAALRVPVATLAEFRRRLNPALGKCGITSRSPNWQNLPAKFS